VSTVTTPESEPSILSTRIKLSMIFLLPIIVIAASSFVYFTGIGMPTTTMNRGQLVIPALSVKETFDSVEGEASTLTPGTTQRWSLVYPFNDSCDEKCMDDLYFIRQVHIALGKYAGRVDRYTVAQHGVFEQAISDAYPHITQLQTSADIASLLINNTYDKEAKYYLIDQQGFIMMSYNQDNTLKDYLTDLKFLFSNTQ